MSTLIWHDVECGGYAADLPLWEQLADRTDEPIMELGCGAGRVMLHLARRGADSVVGIDSDPDLVAALWERSGKLPGDAEVADARDFELATEFGLVIAPMQLIQLLGGSQERLACLSCVVDSMSPGGIAAFAIVEEMPVFAAGASVPPLPDVLQTDGWIYSSLPLVPENGSDSTLLRRLRQTVDPEGNLSEEMDELEVMALSAPTLEEEGRAVGLRPAGRRAVPATGDHVGSTVVLFEKEA